MIEYSFIVCANFRNFSRVSPEHYFTELAVKDTEIADRLGITFDLNVPLLCEVTWNEVLSFGYIQYFSCNVFFHYSTGFGYWSAKYETKIVRES